MASSSSDDWAQQTDRAAETAGDAQSGFEKRPPQSDEFLLRLLRNLPGMAYRCRNDADWTMEFVSDGCRTLTGFTPQDLMAGGVVSFGSLIHPDDRERVWNCVQDAVLQGTSFKTTYRLRRVDGSERTVWEQGCAVHDAIGKVTALEGFITDITDLTELTERVREHEHQFRALVEQALTGVYIIGDGRFRYVNPRFAEIFGYSIEEILALKSVAELVHPEDRDLVLDNLQRRFDGELEELHYDFRANPKDGGDRVVEVHGRRIELEDSPAVIGTLLDVTERRRAARRYHTAQKLEALGRLATGVAHDLNNFLSTIKSTAELLMAERGSDASLLADLEGVVAAVDRGTALSRQLTEFGNPRPSSGGDVSIEELIRGITPILRRMLGDGVALSVHVDPDLPPVALDRTHAEEIVVNLAVNARDAMPEGGALGLSVRRAAASVLPGRDSTTASSQASVVIEVADTGLGIESHIRERIFEPYFTTKGDLGTGLGLANVWRIVSGAGGVVEVESEPGEGSTFRVMLPAARGA